MTDNVIYGIDFADKRIGQMQPDGSIFAAAIPAGTTVTEDMIDAIKLNAMNRVFEEAKRKGPDLTHEPTARLFTAPDGDCA